MLEAQGSALVAGQAGAGARTQRVRLLRAVLIGGVRQEVGQELDVSATLAPELYQRRVAEPVIEASPPSTPAPTPQPSKPAPAAPAKTAARRAAKE